MAARVKTLTAAVRKGRARGRTMRVSTPHHRWNAMEPKPAQTLKPTHAGQHTAPQQRALARQALLDSTLAQVETPAGVAPSQLVLEAFRADLRGFRWSW